jgi:hypothetical protein
MEGVNPIFKLGISIMGSCIPIMGTGIPIIGLGMPIIGPGNPIMGPGAINSTTGDIPIPLDGTIP